MFEEKFVLCYEVIFKEGGVFYQVMGVQKVMMNMLYGQGIKIVGLCLVIDGYVFDGIFEVIYVYDVSGFIFVVQWYFEYNVVEDFVS